MPQSRVLGRGAVPPIWTGRRVNAPERPLSNFCAPHAVIGGMKARRSSSKLGKLMVYAPLILQVVSALRRQQMAKRGKYTKLRKRDRALDFMLGQAERRLGGKKTKRRGWF